MTDKNRNLQDDYIQQELEVEYETAGEATKRDLGIWKSSNDASAPSVHTT